MKKLFSTLIVLPIFLAGFDSISQPATVTWPLSSTSTTSAINTGNVLGTNEVYSELVSRDYTGTSGSQRSHTIGNTWPGESTPNYNRYLQFAVSPAAGNNFTINNIQMLVGGSGGSNMRVSIAYSKDPAFSASTVIYSSNALPISSLNTVSNSPASMMLLDGETFYLRVYPFYGAASTSKYIVLKDVIISGTTSSSVAAPTLTTAPVYNVGSTTATSGGTITVNGGSAILQKGVVWSTSTNPTIASNSGITNDGNGMSSFTSQLNGLTPNSVYYVRAYATNSTATGYGNEIQFATTLAGISYYNKPNTDVTELASWGNQPDGSGTSPTSFTADGQIFNLVNNGSWMSNYWVILGTDSKVVLGSNDQPVSFAIPVAYGLDGTIDLMRNATLTVKNTTGLTFGSLNDTSTVIFDGVNVVPLNYPNLEIRNGANFPSSGMVGIRGSFVPHNGGVATAGSTVSFYGNSSASLPSNFIFDSLRLDKPFLNNAAHLHVNRGLVINEDLVLSADSSRLTLYNNASLSIASGKQLLVYGIFDNQSTGSVNMHNNNLVIKSGGTYLVNASVPSSYTIPAIVFEPGSTLKVMKGSGKIGSSIGGNVVWNGTGSSTYLASSITVGGDFTQHSGTLNQGGNRTLTVAGNFVMNGGSYSLGPEVGAGNAQHLVINGDLQINNGDLKIAGIDTMSTFYSTLTVKGNINHSGGSFGTGDAYREGRLILNGSNQTVSTIGINNNTKIEVGTASLFSNVTLASDVNIPSTGILKIVNGSMVVLPNKVLTVSGTADFNGKSVSFKSDSVGTASFGPMTGTLTGATNVTVERFIHSANKGAYRLLAPSVNSTLAIQENWQYGGTAYGTYIFGRDPGVGGFDTGNDRPSAFTYNVDITPTTDIVPAWIALPNTQVKKLEADTGYLVYIRGDRTLDKVDTTVTGNTTLAATGSLVTGTHVFNNLRPTVYNLITNPYASAISFTSLRASNPDIANRYIYWDPNVGTAGGYVVINGDGTATPALRSTNQGMNIQSGQAFFVRPLNTTSVSVHEEHKTNINNLDVFRTGSQSESLTASVYFRTTNNSRKLADGVSVFYNNNYSAGFGNEDALQLANFGEDVAIMSNGRQLAIEGRPLVDSNETLQLYADRLQPKTYDWEINAGNFNSSILSAVLKDNYTNTSTPLNLNGSSVISFKVTNDAGSKAANRFQVVFATAKSAQDSVAVNMCDGGNTTISSNLTGTQYQWQVYNGSNYENIANSSTFQGTSTANLQISAGAAFVRGNKYRCAVTTGGITLYSKIFTIVYRNYWTGAESDAWQNPANWSCGQLPGEHTDVLISAGPVKVTGTAVCRSLEATSEAEIIVKAGATLEVKK